ncbi:translation initiation factor IF-2-like [Vulpes lagopus]|uniref:translation initiation factor IF-2-like n=1 Tax=Vulpes lagopus TaxID=494514 RepID=UPI001BC97A83|nr:translation initiation factor IF-2-like [Vulpes lagopus]
MSLPRPRAGWYIKAEWPGGRQSAEAARARAELPDPGGGARPPARRSALLPPPPRPRAPTSPGPRAELPWALSRACRGDAGGDLGARAGDAQQRRARRGVRAARPGAPGRGGRSPRGRGDPGAWGPPRRAPAISARPERAARGWPRVESAGNGARGSGPPNVDYLVCISRARTTPTPATSSASWACFLPPGSRGAYLAGEIGGLRLAWGCAPRTKKEGQEKKKVPVALPNEDPHSGGTLILCWCLEVSQAAFHLAHYHGPASRTRPLLVSTTPPCTPVPPVQGKDGWLSGAQPEGS